MKTFKTKLYLSEEVKQYCKRAFGVRRCLWNWAVAYCIEERKINHERPNNYKLDGICREKIAAQADSSFRWIAEQQVTSQMIQEIMKEVKLAFSAAVKKKGYGANAHFKSRKDRLQTFSCCCTTPTTFVIEGDRSFTVAGGGRKRGNRQFFRTHRSLAFLKDAKLCRYTITCKAGEYWLCLTYEKHNRKKTYNLEGNLGIDLGIVKSVCAYDGTEFSDVSFNTKRSLKYDRLSKNLDAQLSRQVRGSKRYEKNLLMKQRRAAKAARMRKEQVELYTTHLTETYEKIVVDDYSFKGALNVANHEKAYRCMKFQFKNRLEQKAAKTGTIVEYVQHQKGVKTTHKCSECGSEHVHTTGTRQFHCLDCGYVADRDQNAARNAYLLA